MTTETENPDPFVNYDSHLKCEYWNTIQHHWHKDGLCWRRAKEDR